MISAELSRQLMIKVDNKIGTLAEISASISSQGINFIAICAYAVNNTVAMMFVTEDNNATKSILEAHHYTVQEEEVVLLTIDNKPGSLQHVTDKIAENGIDLKLIYGSVDSKAETSRIVLISNNNLDVMMIVKTELERRS